MNLRWQRAILFTLLGLTLASASMPALAADPLVLFLLRMMRDQIVSSAIEAGVEKSQQPSKPEVATVAPPAPRPSTEGQWLKGLIDESFIHLTPQQREELHASLTKMLADPRNAPMRAEIVSEFTRQAIAVRDAHRQLSRLSEPDMKVIAAEARVEFQRLPPDERQQLVRALQHGVPGMPRALHELMLAEFASVPSAR
jgi:hypothetical protein